MKTDYLGQIIGLVNNEVSHDQIIRFLSKNEFGSKEGNAHKVS